MATRTAPSRRELEVLVAEFRHVRSEHERAGRRGSVRRHLHTRLLHLSERFDRLLEEWVPGEEIREAWRACLHHGAPAPAGPSESPPALVFKGRSATSAEVFPQGRSTVLPMRCGRRRATMQAPQRRCLR